MALGEDPFARPSSRLAIVLAALASFLGCSGGSRAQVRDDSQGTTGPRVYFVPIEEICPEETCEYRAEFAPPARLPSADIEAGLDWIVRYGHKLEVEMPKLTDSVYVVGEFVPKGHQTHVKTLKELRRLAYQQKDKFEYIKPWVEAEDIIVNDRVRGRGLTVRFGFEPSRLGAIGSCGFILYRDKDILTITDNGCGVR